MEKKTLVIERSKWLRGLGDGMLLSEEGTMCCLGFACKQFTDLVDTDLLNIGPPSRLKDELRTLVEESDLGFLLGVDYDELESGEMVRIPEDTDVAKKLMKTNDNKTISDTEREVKIKDLFKPYHIDVKFVP